MSLEGVFASVDNSSFPDGCVDAYAVEIAGKAEEMAETANGVIPSQLCAHATEVKVRYTDTFMSGQNGQVKYELHSLIEF